MSLRFASKSNWAAVLLTALTLMGCSSEASNPPPLSADDEKKALEQLNQTRQAEGAAAVQNEATKQVSGNDE